ncbi:hypothetical protein GW17_00033045 [Ensete ventricosum]|nr:hypothetical protein GW17_00033045 [Ensete ventricosum]RZR99081.1 hypothetical protein BHM03_00028564 [Ensete ventricosum]
MLASDHVVLRCQPCGAELTHVLTSIRHVNKTDVVTLGSAYGSLSHIMDASMEDLARCPGIGERKVLHLW